MERAEGGRAGRKRSQLGDGRPAWREGCCVPERLLIPECSLGGSQNRAVMPWGEAAGQGLSFGCWAVLCAQPRAGRCPWGWLLCSERGSGALSWGRALKTLWVWEEITHNGPSPETPCAVLGDVLPTGDAAPVLWRSWLCPELAKAP